MTDKTDQERMESMAPPGDTYEQKRARLEVFHFMLSYSTALKAAGFTDQQVGTIIETFGKVNMDEDKENEN